MSTDELVLFAATQRLEVYRLREGFSQRSNRYTRETLMDTQNRLSDEVSRALRILYNRNVSEAVLSAIQWSPESLL